MPTTFIFTKNFSIHAAKTELVVSRSARTSVHAGLASQRGSSSRQRRVVQSRNSIKREKNSCQKTEKHQFDRSRLHFECATQMPAFRAVYSVFSTQSIVVARTQLFAFSFSSCDCCDSICTYRSCLAFVRSPPPLLALSLSFLPGLLSFSPSDVRSSLPLHFTARRCRCQAPLSTGSYGRRAKRTASLQRRW